MTYLITGCVLMVAILSTFYLRDLTGKSWLGKLAYSGLVARLAVVATVLIVLGAILTIGDLFN
ncbi:hypothetical protein ACFL17_10530 [Pseudomonadota bacterium]